ncbi:MAG: hypothetical protein MPK05_02315, partial [Gammaproteobacteria bacterium]|nr:hypothetical protein [Gammaproteobacteria bacterium]
FSLCQLLLCENPVEKTAAEKSGENPAEKSSAKIPCNQCRNCKLFRAGTHPDFHMLTTELEAREGRIALAAQYCERYQDAAARERRAKPGKVIAVDQVRLLIERFSMHAHTSARKVALLMPADRLNINAANALLKLLEEPPANSFLILLSALPGKLPATVRSRCMRIPAAAPQPDAAAEWLRMRLPKNDAELAPMLLEAAGGGPLDALKLHAGGFLELQAQFLRDISAMMRGAASALDVAAKFAKHDFPHFVDWLQRVCCGVIRCNAGAGETGGPAAQLGVRRGQFAPEALFNLYDRIGYYRGIAREPLNEQLAVEELTLALRRALRS